MYDIEKMCEMVVAFDNVRESFNQRFSLSELEKIYSAWVASDWDVRPSAWSERQLGEALGLGRSPSFYETQRGLVPAYYHKG